MEVVLQSDAGKASESGFGGRVLAALNPPTKELIRSRNDDLYAADVFVAEKPVRYCRMAAFLTATVLAVLTIFIPIDALQPLTSYFESVAIKVLLAIATFLLAYPKLVRLLFSAYVNVKLSEKREKIDRNFYTALCALFGFGRGDIPISRAIELIAKSNLKGVREEFAKIHAATAVLGQDVRTAMLKVALTTPSEKLSHFLKGLVSFLERSKSYGDYVEEYLQLDNVNRRIELAAYGEKLKNISTIYIALVTLLASLSIISISNIVQEGFDYSPYVVYVALPLVSASTALLFYLGCPEKETERPTKRFATYATAVMLSVGFFAVFADDLTTKTSLLIAGSMTAAAAHVYVRRALKADEVVEQELNALLTKLYASTRAGESVVNALKTTTGELAKRLAGVIATATTRPVGKALSEEADKAKHPFLAVLLYVLGNVVHSTRKFADVLTALIFEYHRHVEYSKLKRNIATTTSLIVLLALVLTAFCMGVVKLQMIPTLEGIAAKAENFYFDGDYARRIANDTVVVMAATTPFVLASVTWDFRRSFKYYAFTYALAFAFVYFT